MDRRIVLQSPTVATSGDPTSITWTTQATVWAERVDPRGTERYTGVTVTTSTATQSYRIRYDASVAVDPTWRVVDGTEYWRVTSVLPGFGRNRESIVVVERMDPDDEA